MLRRGQRRLTRLCIYPLAPTPLPPARQRRREQTRIAEKGAEDKRKRLLAHVISDLKIEFRGSIEGGA